MLAAEDLGAQVERLQGEGQTVVLVGTVAEANPLQPVVVLGHEISEFVVIGSGLRMLRG